MRHYRSNNGSNNGSDSDDHDIFRIIHPAQWIVTEQNVTKPAVAGQQREPEIRQSLCVNREYDSSTSGEWKISAKESARNIADAVSGVGDSYVQSCCASCIQDSVQFYGWPASG